MRVGTKEETKWTRGPAAPVRSLDLVLSENWRSGLVLKKANSATGWKWSWGGGSRGQQVRRSQEAAGTLQVRGDGASPGGQAGVRKQAGWKQRWPLCCPDIWHPGHMWPHPDQKMDMRKEKLDLPQQPWDAGRGNSKGF